MKKSTVALVVTFLLSITVLPMLSFAAIPPASEIAGKAIEQTSTPASTNVYTRFVELLDMLESLAHASLSLLASIGSLGATSSLEESSAEALTFQLLALRSDYVKAPSPALQAQLLATMMDRALARKQALSVVMETNPEAALRIMLPPHLRQSFPDEVQVMIEERATLEGDLQVSQYDDVLNEISLYRYTLYSAQAGEVALHFVGEGPLVGGYVSVTGMKLGGHIVLSDSPSSFQLLGVQTHGVAENLTLDLLAKHKRGASTAELVAVATGRKQALRDLLKTDPAEIVRVSISNTKRSALPAEVVSLLEENVSLEGTLDVFYEDYEDVPVLRHFIKTAKDERFEVWFADTHPNFRSGTKIKAKGVLLKDATATESINGDLVIPQEGDVLLLADDGTTTSTSELAYDLPNALGAQRTLAILVNFQDKPTDKPWTVSQVNTMMFTTVSDFYKENSLQQTWLTGAVAGWYTIAVNSTVCDGFAIQNAAKSAAQASGYVLSNYDRFVFIFPANACGYSGMGQVGAWPSSTWIHNSMMLRTIAHEMGHNFGLHHAHALDCGTTTLGSTCTTQEYGDTLDIMGYSGTVAHFNAFNKERLGWFASGNLVTVGSGGTFSLAPFSNQSTGAKALKISKGLDTAGAASYYYVEYRQPIGFDAQITDRGVVDPLNVFNGATIHQGSPSNGNSGNLLDMTAGSNFVDMKDAALTAGRSFNDAARNITVTTQSVSSSQASVSVSLSGGATPTCTRANPTLTVTPTQSSYVAAGTPVTYSLTLKNNDSSVCASNTFTLTATKPSSLWTVQFANSSLTASPGASVTSSFTATSPSGTADGFYTITAIGTSGSYNGSKAVTYALDNPASSDTTAPTITLTAPTNGATISGTVTLAASASDNVGVTKVEFYKDGALFGTDTTSPYSLSWNTTTATNGSHTLYAKAYDAAGNSKLTSIITVTVSNLACIRANPTMTISPLSQWGNAGQALTYTVTLTNKDNSNCSASTFNVAPTLPSGWTQSPTSFALTLSPGASQTKSFTVTSAGTASGGSYSFSEKAINNSATTYTVTVSGTYNVNAVVTDTTKPLTSITSPVNGATLARRSTITIAASGSDNVGVSRVEFRVSGTLICTDTIAPYTCAWTVPGGKVATYGIQSKAYDAAGNYGLSSTISVTGK